MIAILTTSRLIHSKTATTRPLPIERALKNDILTILAVYQYQYSDLNILIPTTKSAV